MRGFAFIATGFMQISDLKGFIDISLLLVIKLRLYEFVNRPQSIICLRVCNTNRQLQFESDFTTKPSSKNQTTI